MVKNEALKILVIDDDIGAPYNVYHKDFLKKYGNLGFEYSFTDGRDEERNFSLEEVIEFILQNLDASLILLDIMFGDQKRFGIQILERIGNLFEYIPVIMLTSVADAQVRDECLKKGAKTYFVKDPSVDEFQSEIRRYSIPSRDRIIGSSPAIQQVRDTIRGFAEAPSQPVLIMGESGTGKELVARNIHRLGKRGNGPFVAINCAQFDESLEGSELFGHVKGAFTGAEKEKLGLIEVADGGVLFLDEIGSMRLGLQEKLLRVLEDGLVRRVGDTQDRKVDVQIFAATNYDLSALVQEKKFSESLFYRLNGLFIHLPPLRQRKEDILELVDYFLDFLHYRDYPSDPRFQIDADAIKALEKYQWPGNVRELMQSLGLAIVNCYKIRKGNKITVQDLSPSVVRTKQKLEEEKLGEPTLPEDEREWAKFFALQQIKTITEAYAHTGENSARTIGGLFPNVRTPSETYLRRLAYQLVEGTWGNRSILLDPDLRKAFETLMEAYQKGKKEAEKNKAKTFR